LFLPRRSALLISILCTCILPVKAQVLQLESAESRSLSESSLAHSLSRGLSVNPALDHSDAKQPVNLLLQYTPNIQGLSDAYSAAVEGSYYAAPIDLSFSAGASTLAFSTLYSDVDAILGVTKVFNLSDNRHVSVGARYRYKVLSFSPPYPPVKFNILDLGFAFDATSEFSIGGAGLNLLGTGTSIGSSTVEQFYKIFLIGATYHPSDAPVSLHTSIEEIASFPVTLHFGAEYIPVEYLILRAGTSTDIGNITAGAAVQYEQYGVDIMADFDRHYGTMLTLGLSAKW
jgi:hypothetical protein